MPISTIGASDTHNRASDKIGVQDAWYSPTIFFAKSKLSNPTPYHTTHKVSERGAATFVLHRMGLPKKEVLFLLLRLERRREREREK